MKKFLTIIMSTALLLSSAQLFAADKCDEVLYENNGKSVKAGDISYNGSMAFIGGVDGLDGVVNNDVDMFNKVLAKHLSNLKGIRYAQITGMNPLPKRSVFDKSQNKYVSNELKQIPLQTYKSGKGVMLGANAWQKPIELTGDDLVTLYYDAFVASYAEKLNILSVDPATFAAQKSSVIEAVKKSSDKIKACEDEKVLARKELAKLVGVSEVEKPNYSDADQITLQSAIDAADDVHDNPLATLTELKDAKIKLETEKGKLTPTKKSNNDDRGKVLALNNLKDLIDEIEGRKDMFPAYLFEELNPELNDAKAVRDNASSTTPEIEKAHDDLMDAYTKADADLLKGLIALVEGGLDGYSDDAKAILEPVIKDAKVVRDNPDAEIEEIDVAITDLLNGKIAADMKDGKVTDGEITDELLEDELAKLIKELEKKKPIQNPTIDNDTRLALIDLIEGLLADYSDAAKGDLEKAIKDARAIINNPDSSNADLEKALLDLIKAKLAADMKDGKITKTDITDLMVKEELDRLLKLLGKVPGKQKSY
ncbi:MAG TPA: hypothetical protein PK443_01065, partial [bacterium]|nr:hypothetical protein [bacterium]